LQPTLAAIDCGNMLEVARIMRRRFPLMPIIIAADNDPKDDGTNPGLRDANKAARAVFGGKVAVPPPNLDFNDVYETEGPERVREIIAAAIDPSPEEEEFETDKNDRPLPKSQHNIRLALKKLGIALRYDSFHDRMLIDGLAGHAVLDDPAVDKLWLLIDDKFHFLPARVFFFTVVSEAARRNTFHPVKDYLDGLVWDGTPRIDRWLVDYGGAEATEFVCTVGAIMLVAAVRRIRQPGVKFDEMPILESPQGTDKSTALRTLAVEDDWFGDDLPLTADSKKVIEQSVGKWIMEVPDICGMGKSKVDHLKAMLSRQSDHSRLGYDRLPSERPRQFIPIGTTNETIYLRDITGNRRFWPVKIVKIDIEAIRRDLHQLWAEAAAREANGASIRLDVELWEAASEEQEQRLADDPWLETMTDALGNIQGMLRTKDAWDIIGMRDAERRTQEDNRRLGNIMAVLDFKRKKLRFDGAKPTTWCYVRGDEQLRIYVSWDGGSTLTASNTPPPPPRYPERRDERPPSRDDRPPSEAGGGTEEGRTKPH
jgi:hypothetical protein